MKRRLLSILGILVMVTMALPMAISTPVVATQAFTVFADDFGNGGNVNNVTTWNGGYGNWNVDSDGNGSDAALRGLGGGGSPPRYLRLRSGQSVEKHNISTAGLANIHLEYTWGYDTDNDGSDDGDLVVQWRVSGTGPGNWTTVNTHNLPNNSNAAPNANSEDEALGASADNTSIDIRFWGDTDEDDDEAWVDNVIVSGDQGCINYWLDEDDDDYGTGDPECLESPPVGYNYALVGGDCDDDDPAINPGATEVCDGVDNNCDGNIDEGVMPTWYADDDGDGYGDPLDSIQSCDQPGGYVADNTDCDDTNFDVNPGAAEICGDQIDNDCDGYTDIDDPDCACAGLQVQLAMILDGSGSIASGNWTIIVNGLADAVANGQCFPQDGTVELTVIQFAGNISGGAQIEIGPVVITASNAATVAAQIQAISQAGGYTPLACGIYLAADTLYASPCFDPSLKQAINVVTDGEPNRCCTDTYSVSSCTTTEARASAVTARDYLISLLGMDTDPQDEIDAEFIGTQGGASDWLRDSIVYPQPGYYAPPFTTSGWVRVVANATDFAETICEKFTVIVCGPCEYYDPASGECVPYCPGEDTSCGCTECLNCNDQDGPYPVGDPYTCCSDDGTSTCTCQDYRDRDYYCENNECVYTEGSLYTVKTECTSCGTDYYGEWEYYCVGNEVWRHQWLTDYSCVDGSCTIVFDGYTNEEFVEDCDDYDSLGSWEYYCVGNEVWRHQWLTDYSCAGGSCTIVFDGYTNDEFVEDCDDYDYLGSWEYYCVGNEVWRHQWFDDYSCSGGSCTLVFSGYINDEFVSDCDDLDYLGEWEYYCVGNEVWRHQWFDDYSCSGGSCTLVFSGYINDEFVSDCTVCNMCDDGQCVPDPSQNGNYCDEPGEWETNPQNPCQEMREVWVCQDGSCVQDYEYRNKDDGTDCPTQDYYDDYVYYCKENGELWKHQLFHDFYCTNGECTDHTSWENETLVDDCNSYDGWYDLGSPYDCCYEGLACTCQDQEYRDYFCDAGLGICDYTVTDYQTLHDKCEDCDQYDYYGEWEYYCLDGELWYGWWLTDWECVDGTCTIVYDGWMDNFLVDDCNSYDGWYNVGEPYACCYEGLACTCQDQEYRDYFCDAGLGICDYTVTDYQTLHERCEDCDDGDPCTLDWCDDGTCHHSWICGGGGGPVGPEKCYLWVDMLGEIYRVEMKCCPNESVDYHKCLDPDGLQFLEIDEDMEIICGDCAGSCTDDPKDCTDCDICRAFPKVIVMSLAEESPTPPDGTVVVGGVYYDLTGYKDTLRTVECEIGTFFYPAISMLLIFDPDTLDPGASNPRIAWYDAELGVWNPLPYDPDRVAGVGEVTGETNVFASTFAILVDVPEAEPTPAPPPPATPEPAHFVVSNLNITPAEVKTEETVTISVNVTNDGEQEGTYLVELTVNGQAIDDQQVTLGAGQSEEVTFAVSADEPGEYEVVVSGLSGEFTVLGGINWWLWGSIIAVVILFIAWLIWYRRRRMGAEPAS